MGYIKYKDGDVMVSTDIIECKIACRDFRWSLKTRNKLVFNVNVIDFATPIGYEDEYALAA